MAAANSTTAEEVLTTPVHATLAEEVLTTPAHATPAGGEQV